MTRSRRPAARRSGMSLLEVIVALAIFIMSFAALGQLVQLGMEQAVEADRQTVATRLAQSTMAEVEAGALPFEAGSGTFEDQELIGDGSPLWKWEVTLADIGYENVAEVTVTVSLLSGGPFSLSLSQIIYDPTMLGTAAPSVAPADPNATPMGNTP